MRTLILINPNTSQRTTDAMLQIAREAAGDWTIAGFTAPFGAPLITDEAALEEAARAVESLAPRLGKTAGVIVAAFGDPGLALLRSNLAMPVTGIAEAGMAEAAAGGRRFAVVTTTPDLVASIARAAAGYGHAGRFAGTYLTPGDPVAVMAEQIRLVEALDAACRRAIRDGAEAVVIGGGPLAVAARALAGTLDAELVEPLLAAVRLALRRAQPVKETQ
jgi:Asp/Glu/hydantoin racemase